ncbi:MAG: hypothetical protein ABI347_00190 [Nitrososphaera sp.]
MRPIKIAGLGLISTSTIFFWQPAEIYQDYSTNVVRFSDHRHDGCLGCPLVLEAEQGYAKSMTFWGVLFVAAGFSVVIFSPWSDNKKHHLQERQD